MECALTLRPQRLSRATAASLPPDRSRGADYTAPLPDREGLLEQIPPHAIAEPPSPYGCESRITRISQPSPVLESAPRIAELPCRRSRSPAASPPAEQEVRTAPDECSVARPVQHPVPTDVPPERSRDTRRSGQDPPPGGMADQANEPIPRRVVHDVRTRSPCRHAVTVCTVGVPRGDDLAPCIQESHAPVVVLPAGSESFVQKADLLERPTGEHGRHEWREFVLHDGPHARIDRNVNMVIVVQGQVALDRCGVEVHSPLWIRIENERARDTRIRASTLR